MIAAWRKFAALDAADRGLLAESAALLMVVRIGLWTLPFRTLRRFLRHHGRKTQPAAAPVERVAWAIAVASRRLPGPMTCLVQALAADALLRRCNHTPELRIGVKGGRRSATVEAHAWVACEGAIVVGGIDDLADYFVLSAAGRQ